MPNILNTLQNNLCTGCGICEDVCPKRCISIERIHGENRPIVKQENCLGDKCSRCFKTCPGIGINLVSMAKEIFQEPEVKENKFIGRYLCAHTGYSLDEKVRFHSASGGVLTQFLVFLLEKKIINGAVVTGFAQDHITPRSYIARSKDELLKALSSKYCPVQLSKVGNEIVKSTGKYIIVGLPCHIQGFRKRARIDKRFRDKILGFFSLYCSSERTYYAQDYLFHKLGITKNNVEYFAFRDEGCLGNLTICQRRENDNSHTSIINTSSTNDLTSAQLKKISIPYITYYGPVLRSFFKPYRCLLCIDHYGELADVSFGDIHIPPYDQDKVGISSWITRSKYWEDLFQQAKEKGFIHMDKLNVKTLNKSQSAMLFPQKRRVKAMFNLNKLIHRKFPIYDKCLEKPLLKDYFADISFMVQQFIGRHKCLWFMIDELNKKIKL